MYFPFLYWSVVGFCFVGCMILFEWSALRSENRLFDVSLLLSIEREIYTTGVFHLIIYLFEILALFFQRKKKQHLNTFIFFVCLFF